MAIKFTKPGIYKWKWKEEQIYTPKIQQVCRVMECSPMLEITQITKKASSNVTDFKVEFIEAHWGEKHFWGCQD